MARQLGIRKALVGRWSGKWGWVERVRAWERAERLRDEAARREARQKAIREMEERHVAIAKGMQAQLIQRLQTLRAEELTPGTMAQMFDVAVKVERLALGAATARVDAEPPAESYFESAIGPCESGGGRATPPGARLPGRREAACLKSCACECFPVAFRA
ncbi:MAG: hypothetical protein IT177_18890 [Acidobacteria bacterium]|nr:hypothetical protein [Acidobacteriota bacterium]